MVDWLTDHGLNKRERQKERKREREERKSAGGKGEQEKIDIPCCFPPCLLLVDSLVGK